MEDSQDRGSRHIRRVLLLIFGGAALLLYAEYSAAVQFQWTTASPESEGMSAQKLTALASNLFQRGTKTFLVIRNDRIVYERYATGFSPTTGHYTASAVKALAGGTAVALAVSDGRLNIDNVAASYVSQWRTNGLPPVSLTPG